MQKVGHLFQGRFKSILVERNSYILELLRYVVLNPVRASMMTDPGKWIWSSYCATAGLSADLRLQDYISKPVPSVIKCFYLRVFRAAFSWGIRTKTSKRMFAIEMTAAVITASKIMGTEKRIKETAKYIGWENHL